MPTLEDVIGGSSAPENEAVTSPSASETSAAPSPSASEEAVSSSSASEKASDDKPKSLDDAILKVVEPKADDTKAADASASPDATDVTPKDEKSSQDDPSEAELANYSEKARKRILEVLGQRDELKAKVEALEVDAGYARQLGGYLQQNNLSAEDTNLGLGIMAALRRGDFKLFLDGIRPYVEAAEMAIGQRLPAELREQVEQGLIPEETARRLTVTEQEAVRLRAEMAARQQAEESAVQTREVNLIRSTVAQFEATLQQTDPDFGAKQVAMQKFALALVAQHGPPKDAAQALQYAQQAHREATDFLATARPAARPTRPSPSSGQQLNVPATSKPKSFEAAIESALTQGRAGL